MARPKHLKPTLIPQPRKEPTALNKESAFRLNPAWRVSRIEMCDPFGWHTVPGDKLKEIREKLGHLESRTWADILVHAKKQNHFISVDKISKQARDRLESLHLDDTDALVSLRLSGKERVWGILQENALLLLWWDPGHGICPSILD